MESVCLARFMQISDLHFGDIDRNGTLLHPWWLKLLWKRLPVLSGLIGHEHQALLELSECFATRMRNLRPAPSLIVTGDLTSLGKDEQFVLAEQFICGELSGPKFEVGVGLKLGNWLRAVMKGQHEECLHQAIPGNHDHWPGSYYMLGPPCSRIVKWSSHLPYLQNVTVPLPDTPAHLRFLALNSDADVGNWGGDRALRTGSFHSQLRKLRTDLLAQMKQPDPNEIRVLLMHHSLAYKAQPDGPPPRTRCERIRERWRKATDPRSLEVDDRSRAYLKDLISEFDIRVLLTGHTHKVFLKRDGVPSRRFRRLVSYLEACCGTTTQLINAPPGHPESKRSKEEGQSGQIASNTFLLHEPTLRTGLSSGRPRHGLAARRKGSKDGNITTSLERTLPADSPSGVVLGPEWPPNQ